MNPPAGKLSLSIIAVVAIGSITLASGLPPDVTQESEEPQKHSRAEQRQEMREEEGKLQTLTRTQIFMREKLQICNQILRGLSSDEFEDVTNGADRLLNMSKRSHWLRANNPVYAQDTADFVANVRLLRSMSEHENLAGATLAYSQLIVRCSDCHSHARGPKVALFEPGQARLVARVDRK